MIKFQLMPLDHKITEFGTKNTTVGAVVGDIQIERVTNLIGDFAALINIAKTKQVMSVAAGNPGNILNRQSFDLRHFLCSVTDIGRFISLATKFLW